MFTLPVVTEKVAELAPCATVIDVGTLAAKEFELESVTTVPPKGAVPVRLTVPVLVLPLTIVAGLTEMLLSAGGGGLTVSPAVMLTLAKEAVKVTEVEVVTLPVVTENVADVEPCGTATEAGTAAAVEFELESDTSTPPEPAAEVRVTVPVPGWLLTIVVGLTEMPLSAGGGGLTVNPAVMLTLA